MAGWVASGKIKVKFVDNFFQFGISSCSLLSFSFVIIFSCYHFLFLSFFLVIKVRETVVDGFDKMPQALMGLFTGDNTGKMVVKA